MQMDNHLHLSVSRDHRFAPIVQRLLWLWRRCQHHEATLEFRLQGASMRRWYGEPGLPIRQNLPLGNAGMLQRKGNPMHLVPVLLQKLPEVCHFDHRSSGFTPDFLSWFTFLAFASPNAPTRQWGYFSIVEWMQFNVISRTYTHMYVCVCMCM